MFPFRSVHMCAQEYVSSSLFTNCGGCVMLFRKFCFSCLDLVSVNAQFWKFKTCVKFLHEREMTTSSSLPAGCEYFLATVSKQIGKMFPHLFSLAVNYLVCNFHDCRSFMKTCLVSDLEISGNVF